MIARVTLSHDVLGDHEISPPDGFQESTLNLERDDKFYSLVETFEGDFIFYGNNENGIDGGIDFIRSVLTTYGPDADLSIIFEISFDEINYETIFSGLLDLSTKQDIDTNTMQVAIIRNDFWSKFINRYETPVDQQTSSNIDGDPVTVYDQINVNLTTQKINYNSSFENKVGIDYYAWLGFTFTTSEYVQIDWDTTILDEIKEKYSYPGGAIATLQFELFAMEFGGDYVFDIKMAFSRQHGNPGSSPAHSWENLSSWLDVYIKVNGDTPVAFTRTDKSGVSGSNTIKWSEFSYSGTLSLNAGDFVHIYGRPLQNFNHTDEATFDDLVFLGTERNEFPEITWGAFYVNIPFAFTSQIESYLNVSAATIFDDTNVEGFLIHDVGSNICDRITGEENSFYSEYLGSDQTITRQYPSNGCGWPYTLHKGLQIRQYSLLEKPFFLSFKQWWEGVNPLFNLGLGYDTIGGNEVIRVEDKKHFYSDEVSVNFSNVNNIRASFDNSMFFNVVEIGFRKWESEDISGIDDPQTKHTYATRFKKVGKKITLYSEFIAAGLAIETTRRTTREKSADYKYDNEVFIITIRPYTIDVSPETSPDVADYEPELNENFVSVNNVNNSDSRYNLVLTPARQLLRWLNYLSGCLQKYTSSFFRFTGGEGNYDMNSTYEVQIPDCGIFDYNGNNLSEKGNIEVSTDYLHLPDLLNITKLPMTWEEYELIRDNREMAIGISQTDTGHINCYINTLKYSVFEGTADITCWPKEEFSIEIVEQEFTQNC